MKRGNPRHQKVYDLMESLDCERVVALGILELLWHFTTEYAPQGDVGKYSDKRIEAALDWGGRGKLPGRLIDALVASRWLLRDADVCELKPRKGPPAHGKVRLIFQDWPKYIDEALRKKMSRAGKGFLVLADKVSRRQSDNQPPNEPDNGGFQLVPYETPINPPSVVRSNVAAKAKKPAGRKSRTTKEVEFALGERLPWWEAFWDIYPCKDGKNAAINAYERIVHEYELAKLVYRGAKAYAAKCAANPNVSVKMAQGWLNGERWTDANEIVTIQQPTALDRRRQEEAAAMRVLSEVNRNAG